jgi:hypothetical protein
VAVEGTDESAVALGRGIGALAVGVEEISTEVKEAAEGVIIDTISGAYFFAFSKKPGVVSRVFSQMPPNMCHLLVRCCTDPSGAAYSNMQVLFECRLEILLNQDRAHIVIRLH